jgi:hypothetical protein
LPTPFIARRYRAVLVTVDRHETGEGLHDGIGRGVPGLGSALAEPGQGEIDDGRVVLAHGFVVEAEFLDHAGTVVLQDDVGLARQAFGDRHALRLLKIEPEAALATAQDHRARAVVAIGLAHRAAPVAGGVRLDLDHVGAVLRQQHAAIRRGDALGQVEHLKTFEGELFSHTCVPFQFRAVT